MLTDFLTTGVRPDAVVLGRMTLPIGADAKDLVAGRGGGLA
jgi:hypothetical protein